MPKRYPTTEREVPRAKCSTPSRGRTIRKKPALPRSEIITEPELRRVKGASPAKLAMLESYIAALPSGLDSYPESRVNGATLRSLLLHPGCRLSLGSGLPEALESWLREAPAENDWVPVVHLCAFHAAAYDCMFAGDGGIAAYAHWTFERNKALLATQPYAPLVALQSPELLLTAYRARWSNFYRGCTLDVMVATPSAFVLRLSYPPHCWGEINRVSLAAAFRAGLMVAGARSGTVESKEVSSRVSQFDVQWT